MNIRKIRVIPKRFKEVTCKDVIEDAFSSVNRGELFMRLYTLVGKPDKNLDYLLRFDKFVLLISKDNDYRIWVSPAISKTAEKRRSKTINLMARRANMDNIPFLINEPFKLFFIVNQKNDILLSRARAEKGDKEIVDTFLGYVGDDGKEKIYGSVVQYMPEVREGLDNFIETINSVTP